MFLLKLSEEILSDDKELIISANAEEGEHLLPQAQKCK